MNVYLIVHPVPNNLNQIIKKPAYVIAVDQGLFDAYKQDIKVDLAIGDFDSLNRKDLLKSVSTVKLNLIKDVTDTESALVYAKKLNPSHIYILGGIGGLRFEHSYANLLLLFEYEGVSIISEYTKIKKFGVGKHDISYPSYINVFAVKDTVISLYGFKYNLDKYPLTKFDRLGISNELIEDIGSIEVYQGEVVVMLSKKEQ